MMTEADTKNIYGVIRRMIAHNELPTDQKINQVKLAEQLGVSKTPVVKALNMLAAEGLVDQANNVGFFVHKPSLQEVLELLLIRAGMESIAAYDIAERGDDKAIDQLAAILDPLLQQPKDQLNRDEYGKADHSFHKQLMNLCDNKWLSRINSTVRVAEHPFSLGMLRELDEIQQEHAVIIDALKRHDASMARRAAAEHILNTRKCLADAAKQFQRLGLDASELWMRVNVDTDKGSN